MECECEYKKHETQECSEPAITNLKIYGGWHAMCQHCKDRCAPKDGVTEEDPKL